MGASTLTTLLFPGQGSQTPDMRETVERHRPDLLELALREVGEDLFERAGDGTRWAQPSIFCAALAGYEQLRGGTSADLMAGHSLGEIAALVAADSISAVSRASTHAGPAPKFTTGALVGQSRAAQTHSARTLPSLASDGSGRQTAAKCPSLSPSGPG